MTSRRAQKKQQIQQTREHLLTTLARNIKLFRSETGLDQAEFGNEVAGVTYRTISNWETGNSAPDIIEAYLLAQELGRELSDFLDPHPPKPRRASSKSSST